VDASTGPSGMGTGNMTETQTDLAAGPIAHVAETAFDSLTVAMLLTAEGAFIDGFAFLGHGHVFANVMTANLVLSAVSYVHGDWTRAGRLLLPVASYLAGVLTGAMLKFWTQKWVTVNPQALAIGIAIAILIGIGWLPASFSSAAIVSIISFGNAVRSLFFLRVETWNYASTLPTGNLRQFGEAIFQLLSGMHNPKSKRQTMVFGFITVSFFLGALTGVVATKILHNRAVWVAALFLLAALARGIFAQPSTVPRVRLSNFVLGILALVSSISCLAQTERESTHLLQPFHNIPGNDLRRECRISRASDVSNRISDPVHFTQAEDVIHYLSVAVGLGNKRICQ
jgi:uncharacterized membrane protein YoaK (UPF0700 family)